MPYIHCPDCDAVREMNVAACPECGRCANCGEKVADGVLICECGFPTDEKLARQIERRYSIPEDSLDRERAKWQRRKKLAPVMLAARILLLGLCVLLGAITAWVLLAESNQLTQVVLGVPVVCFLALFYWVFFFGIWRILLWMARKIGIRK